MTDDEIFDNEENESGFEPDPAMVAHLDQEGAAFEDMQDQFEATFGFRHKCRCAEDYASGNIVEVTECFTNMVSESLQACQELMQENVMLRMMLTQIFQQTNTTPEASVEPTAIAENEEDNADLELDPDSNGEGADQ